ncbi:MAG TPA: hypothetical protein VGE38_13470 [Nocardioides sp.]|uniref:hypothetical protein n=1 Tax=Nocardioides sp. TaxID=35761 RepID=UPI002ED8463A
MTPTPSPERAEPTEVARIQATLRECQQALARAREQYEERAEAAATAVRLDHALTELTRHLHERLVAAERVPAGPRGWLKRRMFPHVPTPAEEADLAVLHGTPLLDGPWYLRRYPEVAATGLTPALHYLRHGAAADLDPGPDFSTLAYRRRHPVVAHTGVNPLLHHLRVTAGADAGR